MTILDLDDLLLTRGLVARGVFVAGDGAAVATTAPLSAHPHDPAVDVWALAGEAVDAAATAGRGIIAIALDRAPSDALAAALRDAGFRPIEPETAPSGWSLWLAARRFSMTTLGGNGRFANQILQYYYLHKAAAKAGAIAENPPWIGDAVFTLPPPITPSGAYPEAREIENGFDDADYFATLGDRGDIDLWGYMQHHTSTIDRGHFTSLFRWRDGPAAALANWAAPYFDGGRTVIALHLRRGDYGFGPYFIPPDDWYKAVLAALWRRVRAPLLFIASDGPPSVLEPYAPFAPVTAGDLRADWPEEERVLFDFYMMTRAHAVFASNSSFSVVASMLNSSARIFMRPDLVAGGLVPFDPWNTPVIFTESRS